ncbi:MULTISPECIES: LysR family transcriptional regulator [unclassified Streptomyces]|uniref:LysR family transcriptional regulator n=1 Tax=unclassified Streptomyces TaxID=2593676 RepID=UPI00168A5888|nr:MULTISPECIES: LysR family transcriptional regulator [unclassified Streptomyces]MBD3007458.1 LysR family transcriptional regulator [Streptomyces sp. 5-10]
MRHLRALCAIADTGSLRKAARQLGMTQPSLTTQLRRIENTIGGRLFSREVTGSRPTPLGRSVLCRARPIVEEMNALVSEVRLEAEQAADARLRIGSTGSRAVVGWLRRLRARYPDADTTIHIDVSANALLQMVAANQLDVAFVHEVEGAPLRVPEGVERRVLVEREPQFVALAETHPAAARPVVRLAELAADQWMVDPSVDGEGPGLRRVLAAAGLNPRVVYGDYLTAADLVASGEVVTPCQPTARSRQGVAVRPLHGDPLTVRLFLASRALPAARTGADASAPDAAVGLPAARTDVPESAPDVAARTGADQPAPDTAAGALLDVDALFGDLADAYFEIAWGSAAYRQWLVRNESPLLRFQEPPTREELDILGLAGPAEVS